MKFTVVFNSDNCSIPAISFGCEKIGLNLVDKARELCGLPKLSIALFDDFIKPYNSNITIEIDEQEARRSGLFQEDNTTWIKVPGEFLNKYTTISPMFYRDSKDGRITRVGFEYQIAKTTILVDWMSFGYPKTWGFDGIQNTCTNDQC